MEIREIKIKLRRAGRSSDRGEDLIKNKQLIIF